MNRDGLQTMDSGNRVRDRVRPYQKTEAANHMPLPGARQLSGCDSRPIGPPRFVRPSLLVLETHGHLTEAVEETDFTQDRPPVVQEHLERAPHRDPATGQKPFTQQGDEAAFADAPDEITDRQRRREKRKRDEQADTTSAEQLAERSSRERRARFEILADGLAEQRRFVDWSRGAF